jgi:hypothetical protein
MSNVVTLSALRQDLAPTASAQAVQTGFFDLQSFELMQRVAKMFSSSSIVPEAYRSVIEKLDRYGKVKEIRENPRAVANCAVALSMAQRMNADPMMVMQNLHIIEGRPSWSSQWIIAAINSCGRFSPLHFDIEDRGPREVEYTETQWENGERRTRTRTIAVHDKVCVAWATEKATGNRVESPAVSIEIAVKEGWYARNGSKWQTMPDMMLRYRSAAFFGKLYAPEILMGLGTAEEVHDVIDVSRQADDSYALTTTTVGRLRADDAPATVKDPLTVAPAPAADPGPAPDAESDPPAWPQAHPETGELVDVRAIPWDERIHSSSKACNSDGKWRMKRGADPSLIERLERTAVTSEALPLDEPESAPLPETPEPPPPPMLTVAQRLAQELELAQTKGVLLAAWNRAESQMMSPAEREELGRLVDTRLLELEQQQAA